jgi:hypothetical protein
MHSSGVLANQIFVGAIACAQANHFLVSLRMPEGAGYAEALEAVQHVFDAENTGAISGRRASRVLQIISDASGYSLSDLGA